MLPPQPQSQSLFITLLPLELRQLIYNIVFSSTRLSYGITYHRTSPSPSSSPFSSYPQSLFGGPRRRRRLIPAAHSLAILLVCRAIHHEIAGSWLSHVHFVFTDPIAFLDKLSPLPGSILSEIRHVRIHADDGVHLSPRSFMARKAGRRPCQAFDLAACLALLPGLRLDVLTVTAGGNGGDLGAVWMTLNGLVRGVGGWRELRFLARSDEMLLGGGEPLNARVPGQGWFRAQPGDWNEVVTMGTAGHGAGVDMFRSKQAMTSSGHQSLKRHGETMEPFEVPARPEDWNMGPPVNRQYGHGSHTRELFIVARRGDALCVVPESAPMLTASNDMRNYAEGCQKWSDIREQMYVVRGPLGIRHFQNNVCNLDDCDGEETYEDRYDHVDDFEWPAE